MNNNKKLFIGIAVLLIILLLVFVGKSSNKPQAGNAIPTEGTAENSQGETSTKVGNMLELLKSGNTVKCAFSSNDNNTNISGTVYVSGKSMRNDSKITMENNQTIESHMISDGTWLYSWSSSMPQGVKMKIPDTTQPSTAPNGTDAASANDSGKPQTMKGLQSNYNFKCDKWNIDTTMFTLPTNIQFMDATTPPTSPSQSACSACNYIQDAATKAQCKTSLGCK